MSGLPGASDVDTPGASSTAEPAEGKQRIERNQVLTMAANYARTAKQEASKDKVRAKPKGSASGAASSMFSSSLFNMSASAAASAACASAAA